MSKIEELRTAIADESLPANARKEAAERYIAAMVDAVPEPSEGDAEVVELRTPPNADGTLGEILPRAWAVGNESRGWRRDGPTVQQARKHVHDRLKLRALLAVVVDGAAHHLERLEACTRVLRDHLQPQSFQRKNGYTPEKLLAEVKPANDTKWVSWIKGKVPVERPPQVFADVW